MNPALTRHSSLPPIGKSANRLAAPRSRTYRSSQLLVEERGAFLQISGKALRQVLEQGNVADFIDRLFSLRGIDSVELYPAKGKARLNYVGQRPDLAPFLRDLALVMRLRAVSKFPLRNSARVLKRPPSTSLHIARNDLGLTFWRIEPTSQHHFRLSHPLLEKEKMRRHIEGELATVPEVMRVWPSPLRPDLLHVWIKPHRIDPRIILDDLDAILAATGPEKDPLLAITRTDRLVALNLALAPLSDFLFPPLGYVNALLVALLNAPHLPKAVLNLREGKANVHLLYLCIGLLTLLTFNFLAAALMYGLLRFWPRQARLISLGYETRFIARYRQRPKNVWLQHPDRRVVETRLKQVPPRSIVALSSGDTVPVDGVILQGEAQIDDHLVTGASSGRLNREGDFVYAGTLVCTGEFTMRIEVAEAGLTVSGKIAEWFEKHFQEYRDKPERLTTAAAEKAVFPVLALGLLAVARGGWGMAKATIRADYLSGPQLSEDFLRLACAIRGAPDGLLLPNLLTLHQLRKADCLILDDSVCWEPGGVPASRLVPLLHHIGFPEVIFFADSDQHAFARAARFDAVFYGLNTETKRAYMAQRQGFDRSVLWIGNCEKFPLLAAQANWAVNVLEAPWLTPSGSFPTLLAPDFEKILSLIKIADEVSREISLSQKIPLVPNVLTVLSAFYLGGSINLSVLLTNLGTLANYLRYRSYLEFSSLSARRP